MAWLEYDTPLWFYPVGLTYFEVIIINGLIYAQSHGPTNNSLNKYTSYKSKLQAIA